MGELKNELNETVDIFDYYKIPEERQRYIITSGVYFEFNRNHNILLNCFTFAKLLKFCQKIDPDFDANKLFYDLNNRQDNDYESLVKLFLELDNKEKAKEFVKK